MMMGRIFSGAEKVLIWLGDEQEQICLAFELLEDIACEMLRLNTQKMWQVLQRGFTTPDHPEWVALRHLLGSSWFSRLWVFREVMLARRATLRCGFYTMDWRKLHLLMNSVINHSDVRRLIAGQEPHSWKPGETKIPALWFGHPLSDRNLLSLMKVCQESQATEPNDKIYGLVGLTDDVDTNQLPRDYGLHFGEAYASVTR
ncbi:uncharacterized protein A1O5_03810 [Cladophialophora psammophila CBS 110553]|uniref:Heterokaryon incompatibility domain-containing protein n=1 Tax=Cladophialophora psammophila CBS 110553 TaxID=1182543 RepID=W9XQQ4_9EURO|nr:uncharacterized protein A1O5_03810 [Cladophialophora psammophila CBS 110553]EXJ72664.1 hypothetical protein A1O5_03810 [Cladophialophora psammophila CBS 110553]